MLIYGDEFGIVKPFQPEYIPSYRIKRSTSNSRVTTSDHGYTKDLRKAFIVIRGLHTEIRTLYYASFVGNTGMACTFENGEYPFGVEVDYSSEVNVKFPSPPSLNAINFSQSEISFEATLNSASLIVEKAISLDDGCIQLEYNPSYLLPRDSFQSENNKVYVVDSSIKTNSISFTVIGNFSDISKIKNYLVQDIRSDNLLTLPSGLMLGGATTGYLNSIQENYIGLNDVYLTIDMELAQ